MRSCIIISLLALAAGSTAALAQVGTPSGSPYPTEYPIDSAKPKAVKKQAAPKSGTAPSQPGANALFPTGYAVESTAKPAPPKRRAAKPAPSPPPDGEVKHAVEKPPATEVPLPPSAPRAVTTASGAAKPDEPAPNREPQKSKTANIETKAEVSKEAPKTDVAKQPEIAPGGVSPSDRLKIEQALLWSGDYSSAAAGEDRMQAAIKSFQKRNKSKITGTLTDEQRADLVAAADRHVQEYGWRVVVDPSTGIRIGLPSKLVPIAHDAVDGTRWSSAHGEVQVETFRLKNAALAAVFEKEKKTPNRKLENTTFNDDGFFISGMQGLKYFSVRAKQRDGEVRGFTLLYDQMMEGIVAPAVVAMASAFSPFPERAVPFAVLSKKVEYGTGLVVGRDGHILTTEKVAHGCNVIVADGLGNAELVGEGGENGLALLRVYGAGKLPALALTSEPAKPGNVTLIGIPDPKEQDGARKLTEIKARLANGNAIELQRPVPTAGFSGAAALDMQGNTIGVMETRNFVLASIDPGVPPVRLVPTSTIRDFLAKHGVESAGGTVDARNAVVRIICVRQ